MQLDHLLERIPKQQDLGPQEVVMDKYMSNVEWDELIHIEMVETVVEAEDCCMETDKCLSEVVSSDD
ncbi:hypothetical protein Tco_1246895 [Tanacetum coccineum]